MTAALATTEPTESRIVAFPRCPTSARFSNARHFDETERLDLDRLRWLALRSHLAPKPDLERACFLLAGETGVSLERFAIAFFRGLGGQARRRMVFYRPGARDVSDDEIWLMRLVAARRSGEEAGARALIAWRVRPEGQRWLRFLAAGLVRALDECEVEIHPRRR